MPQRRYRAGKKEKRGKAGSDRRFIRGKIIERHGSNTFPLSTKMKQGLYFM